MPQTHSLALITLRAAVSATGGASSLAIPVPAGTVAGDLLLAQVTSDGGDEAVFTPPAGWTLVANTFNADLVRQAIYWRVATGSEPASYTWSISDGNRSSGGMASYTGVNTASPIAGYSAATSTSTDSHTSASLTPSSAPTRLVNFVGFRGGSVFTPPAAMSERWDVISGVSTQVTVDSVRGNLGVMRSG